MFDHYFHYIKFSDNFKIKDDNQIALLIVAMNENEKKTSLFLAFQGTKNDAHLVFMTFMQMMTFLY
jgi:hypothetical protein